MKKMGLFLGVAISCLAFSSTAFAAEGIEKNQLIESSSVKESSLLLPEGRRDSVDYDGETRGTYIASSSLRISNEGYGVLGALAVTTAHVNVAKIRMNVYLDQWDEENQSWNQISFKQLVYEDKTGEENLHDASEFFTIEGCEPGYYYRLRATHAVWSFEGATEVHATRTDGVMLTEGPL